MTVVSDFNTSYCSKVYPSTQAVVDNTGTCSMQFPVASTGTYQTGAVTVYDSPGTASWILSVNGQPLDVMAGQQSGSGVQIGPNDILTVVATNLQAYLGKTFHATFNAIQSPANDTPLIVPGHDSYFPQQINTPGVVIANAVLTNINAGTNLVLAIVNTLGFSALYVQVGALGAPAGGVNFVLQGAATASLGTTCPPQNIWSLGGSANTIQQTEAIVPVTSPFMILEATADNTAGGNSFTYTITGIPNTAFGPPRLLPRKLLDYNAFSVAASTATNLFAGHTNAAIVPPLDTNVSAVVAPGKYIMWTNWNVAGNFVTVFEWGGSSNRFLTQTNSSATSVSQYTEFILTGNAIIVQAQNLATAAQLVYITICGPFE